MKKKFAGCENSQPCEIYLYIYFSKKQKIFLLLLFFIFYFLEAKNLFFLKYIILYI